MEKQLNWKYRGIHFFMAALLGVVFSYASSYLLDKGFSSTTIGTLLSLSSILSIVTQTSLANLIDKNKSIKIQDVMNGTNLIVVIAGILLLLVPNKLLVAVLVTLVLTVARTHIPFVNSLAFIFEKQGIHINFGIGRAFGSLAHAVCTVVVGQIIQRTAPSIVPIFYIVFGVLYILIVRSYDLKPEDEMRNRITYEADSNADQAEDATVDNEIEESSTTYLEFFKKYTQLVLLFIGVAFMMYSFSLVNTFLIHIISPIGGNNADLGTAIFIAGAVEFPVIMSLDTLSKKLSTAKLMKISTFFYLAKIGILFFATNMTVVYISQLLSLGANAIASPTMVKYINEVVDKKDLVKGQSISVIGITISGVFASFIGGILIDTFGVKTALLSGIISTIIGTIIVLVSAREEVPSKKTRTADAVNVTN